jgi:hypothetical protein
VSEQRTQSVSWSLAIALAAIGGFLAAAGVFLPWAEATGVRTTEIFGEEVLGTHSVSGTGDAIGLVVLALGIAIGAIGVLALLVRSEGLRRAAGLLALGGGIAILVACAVAAFRPDALVGELPPGLRGERVSVETSVAAGLFISGGGGLIAAIGGLLARRAPVAGEPAPAPAPAEP